MTDHLVVLCFQPSEMPLGDGELALCAALKRRGQTFELLRNGELTPQVDAGGSRLWRQGRELAAPGAVCLRTDACGARYEEMYAARWFEERCPVINPPQAAVAARDKWQTLATLSQHEVPAPPTRLLRRGDDLELQVEALGGFPLVAKMLSGSRGQGVALVESMRALRSFLSWTWKLDRLVAVLLQTFLGGAGGRELRVAVIGRGVLGAMERDLASGDFRANHEWQAGARAVTVSEAVARTAQRAVDALGLDYAAVDMHEHGDGALSVFDVNANPQFAQLIAVTGLDPWGALVEYAIERRDRARRTPICALESPAQARAWLFAPGEAPATPSPPRMRRLLRRLGDPQRCARTFVVRGTNGKGSVAAMLDALLEAHGLRVGRYTSPHLSCFEERMTVNGATIDEAEVLATARALSALVRDTDLTRRRDRPCGFDLMTLCAFAHFARAGCEALVIEAGLGGRLDATNVLDARDLAACVLTNVELEHTEVLGATHEAILADKLSGLPDEIALVSAVKPFLSAQLRKGRTAPTLVLGEALLVDTRDLDARGACFDFSVGSWRFPNLEISLPGAHQVENAALALAAFLFGAPRVGIAPDETRIRQALRAASWPGRLEWRQGDPPFLLDVAHNAAGAETLAAYLERHFAPESFVLLCGMSRGKQVSALLSPIFPFVARAIATEASHRARPARELREDFLSLHAPFEVEEAPDFRIALESARRQARALGLGVLVAGSLFLVGDIRVLLVS